MSAPRNHAEPKWPAWRDVKFAPRDGRDVLLCREGARGVYIAWWSTAGGGHWFGLGRNIEPTHFIEIPDAKGVPPVGEVV